ncbi:zinc finger protein 184-like [Syngnathus scovelli]|uniref:zinc finger protein 184-like n=1 Tax=Syngnathus scovelli TaxID=161590 RepID=UPI00210F4C86|nr:zinc finger protein 184-like [Syngnathus scovelli]
MGEVTLSMDELISKVLLPEPQLIILALPPPFLPTPDEPNIVWPKWLAAFERYLEALDDEKLTDTSKCMLLHNCLGQEGQRLFAMLVSREQSYAAAVSALTAYFGAGRATQACLLEFHQRAQMIGESTDEFVTALEALLAPGDCTDNQLILNQLIEKTNLPRLGERLRSQRETLTLATALRIAKEVESEVLNGPDVKPLVQRRKRGRPRRMERVAIETQSLRPSVNWSGDENLQHDEDHGDAVCNDDDEKNNDSASLSPFKLEESLDEPNTDGNQKVRKTFTCAVCTDRHFVTANKLARHMRTHTQEKPFRCPVCATVFSQSYHLTRHMRVQHNAAQHVCSTCCDSFGTVAELKNHKRKHAAQFLLCPYCSERSPNDEAFLRHIAYHEAHQQRDDAAIPREQVQTAMKETQINMQEIQSNMEEIQSNIEKIKANMGESQNNVTESLTDTGSANEREESDIRVVTMAFSGASVPCKKSHVCPVCNLTLPYAEKLNRHMRTHTKEKPFRCTVCSLLFSQSCHRDRHMRKQHGLRQYGCHKCGKMLASWAKLKQHRKMHLAKQLTCPACDKSFKEKAHLESHLRLHDQIPRSPHSLICPECGKVFGRRFHLKRHVMVHCRAASNECYTCGECHKTYPSAEDLKKHLINHAKEKRGTCPRCERNFGSREELEAHLEAHNASYLCSVCGKKFKVEAALRKHEEKHKSPSFHCAVCSKNFDGPAEYKRHAEMHDRREIKCPHCERVFLKRTTFKYHLQTHTQERPYQCVYCMDTFVDNEELERHCLKHRKFRKERPYNCTRCAAAFAALAELTAHMEGHKGEAPLSCDICGRTFLNASKLEKHLSIHTGARPHLCPHCGNGFPTAANLKQHIYSHTGEKPFACAECSKAFRSASGLQLHRRRHTDAPPSFECSDCGRTYGRMTELRMHQRYHTGDRPYTCVSCNKTFVSKYKLTVHARIHTGERPYSCPHCKQTFRQSGDRNRHINKFHPKDSQLLSPAGWL